jgi:hypothetical protein
VRRGSRIKARFGLKAGFDYVVAEKSLVFTSAAADHPEFARELPRFVSEVRRMFTPDEISIHIARVEQRAKRPMPLKTMMNCTVKIRLPSPGKLGNLLLSRSY